MGVPGPLIEIFVQEHLHRPWRGRLLALGRQTIHVEAPRLHQLLSSYGIAWDPSRSRVDRMTEGSLARQDREYVTDETLYTAIAPDLQIDVMDVTDYEGANLIWNMCEPVPQRLYDSYDVIFNGSVLDNIFDPAQAMRNMTRLLSANGRVIHIEMANNLAFEYLMFSTDWLLDYYVVNDFADCRIYVCTFNTMDELVNGPWKIYAYSPRADGQAFALRELEGRYAAVVAIAEKGEHSRFDAIPVQWCYRDDAMKRSYNRRLAALGCGDRRPVFGFGATPPPSLAVLQEGGFLYCGTARG